MSHTPVLTDEVLAYLNIQKGGVYIDATLNGGGHARAILDALAGEGTVIGIERDPELVKKIKNQSIKNLIVEESNYIYMQHIIEKHKAKNVDGVLFDFGLSSWHLEDSGRGFSFMREEPLDMRFSSTEQDTKSAAEIINSYSEADLEDIFYEYGEIPNARRIAHAVVKERKAEKIMTTGRLVEITKNFFRGSRKHPATKLFQALRIAVNGELQAVEEGLTAAMNIVRPGGRVVAISFHSLEDRIVKNMFRSSGSVLTKKPIRATFTERRTNPRSRSAVLRAWENI